MKKIEINEIFDSLQGEGSRVGTYTIFIRFAGCNLKCPFCDTNHLPIMKLTVSEIIEKIKEINPACKDVTITGGEPGLQYHGLLELCMQLKELGYFIAVESNGTFFLPDIYIDWIAVSPKNHFNLESGFYPDNRIDEIKIVIGGAGGIPVLSERYGQVKLKYLQPMNNRFNINRLALSNCRELIVNNPEWKLSVQLHKLIGMR